MHSRYLLQLGAVLAMFSVIFGAFGAHIIKDVVTIDRFATYQTAVEYQFWHALGLLAVALAGGRMEKGRWYLAGLLLFIGTLIFSGSLYLLVFTGISWLGAITPIGGTLMIIGWALFAWSLRHFKQ